MSAIATAQLAADAAFSRYLGPCATAAYCIPESVIDAASIAYARAGGRKEIEVVGRGNTTHPVCSVEVKEVE